MPSRSKKIPIIMPVFVKDDGWNCFQSGKKTKKNIPTKIESAPKIFINTIKSPSTLSQNRSMANQIQLRIGISYFLLFEWLS